MKANGIVAVGIGILVLCFGWRIICAIWSGLCWLGTWIWSLICGFFSWCWYIVLKILFWVLAPAYWVAEGIFDGGGWAWCVGLAFEVVLVGVVIGLISRIAKD